MLTISRSSPASRCSGPSTGIAAIVVQLGLATMPLGRSSSSWGLTSDTTSGTSGCMRQADELSMTVAPAAATFSAIARDVVAPAENRAMSMPDQSAVAASSTGMSAPCHGSVRPADRADAKKRMSPTGNSRSASTSRMTPPTCPVAPTTPTRTDAMGAKATSRGRPGRPQRVGEADAVRPGTASRPKAVCRLWTARSIWPSRTTHDVRMAEVEIISMLMPSPASTSNIVAATPGFDFMPAPTMLTRAMSRSEDTPVAPISSASRWQISVPRARSSFGHGEGDVGDAVVGHVLHDHVDVHVDVGQLAEQAGRDAGVVGHAR